MKSLIVAVAKFILSLALSVSVFELLAVSLITEAPQEKNISLTSITTDRAQEDYSKKQKNILDCLDKEFGINCFKEKEKSSFVENDSKKHIYAMNIVKILHESAIFIVIIVTTIFILMVSTIYSILSIQEETKTTTISNKIATISYDISPFLGMIGTIYSFAIIANGADGENLVSLFKSGFKDAIYTTLTGGIAFITSSVYEVKRDR